MFRFIAFLLNKNYENCKTCEALREQLIYERSVNAELTETLSSLLRPVQMPAVGANSLELTKPKAIPWTKRRRELEVQDKIQADLINRSIHVAKPDNAQTEEINKLERELGIEEEATTGGEKNAN